MHLRDPLHYEAVACLTAIRIGANRIILESDASNLVHSLKSNDFDRSAIGVMAKEARSLCLLNFDIFQFSFARCACNSTAHELAN